ncbi:MAG: 1-deoxy-D-xylulose-5-phosphate reductoisomerase [Phycisphaeraceae bacterium]|nr:1-deoxy-D-xylulose-5-phosphate reductoisomerase [Phycisphaeraceae bacterium]
MPASTKAQSRRLIVLGSTGSIGVNTLAVVDHLRRTCGGGAADIQVVGLAAGRSGKRLIEQARQHRVRHVAVTDPAAAEQVKSALPGVAVFSGPDAPRKLVQEVEATDLAAAIVGAAGLAAVLEAARRGMRISLANKETLVAAGGLVKPLVQKHGAELIPVDSEHSAIFQCLREHPQHEVRRLVLTASGGPFRSAAKDVMDNATVEQALNHPTWSMGPKITIDSASMMNKALEIIEAHWLFDMPSEKIAVIVHPQSIVHSFVEFADHSILAQLGPPDMRTPIQYALTYPQRASGCSEAMDWPTLSRLTFEPADGERFPALGLAYRAIEAMQQGGSTAGAVLNAANEAAVAAFLERKIRFGRIVELTRLAMEAIEPGPIRDLDDVMAADAAARRFVSEALSKALV